MSGISSVSFTFPPPAVTAGPISWNAPDNSPEGLKSVPLIFRMIGDGAVGEFRKNSMSAGVAGGRIVNTASFVNNLPDVTDVPSELPCV